MGRDRKYEVWLYDLFDRHDTGTNLGTFADLKDAMTYARIRYRVHRLWPIRSSPPQRGVEKETWGGLIHVVDSELQIGRAHV